MNRSLIAMLALCLVVPQLRAQQPNQSKDAKESAERTEDIEVLRRILNKSLGINAEAQAAIVTYANPNRVWLNTTNPVGNPYASTSPSVVPPTGSTAQPMVSGFWAQASLTPFDGIYLKGHGVVYTLKIPATTPVPMTVAKAVGLSETCVKCHTQDMASKTDVEARADVSAHRPTEWTRTQAELRNQPIDDPTPQSVDVKVCEPGKLTVKLTEKLFQNQRHIRHLADSESFTIVVTYEGYQGSAKNQQSMTAADWVPKDADPEASRGGVHVGEAQQIRLGDLHLKNQKYQDAIDAYTSALKRFPSPKVTITLASASGMTPEAKETFEQKLQSLLSGAYRGLAEAYIGLKQDDKAAAALNIATKLTVTVQAGPVAPAGEKAITVPAKLVLSFKRGDVAAKDADIRAFRKIVKVETVGFPTADPKPTPKK